MMSTGVVRSESVKMDFDEKMFLNILFLNCFFKSNLIRLNLFVKDKLIINLKLNLFTQIN